MPYIGYGVENSTVDLAEQTITASGNATETLSKSVNEDTELLVFINGVLKNTEEYEIGGTLDNEITFTTTPASGDAILVRYLQKSVDVVSVAPSGVQTFEGRTGNVNLDTADLADKVDTAALKDDAVSSAKLSSSGTSDSLRAVTNNHIRDGAVVSSKIGNSSTSDVLRAITTDHIKDANITTAKIADDSVTPKKLYVRYADEIAANAAGLGEGDIYYDDALNELRTHNGSGWSSVATGGATLNVGDVPLDANTPEIRFAPDLNTTSAVTVNPSTDYAYTFCDNINVGSGQAFNIASGKELKVGVFANLSGGAVGGIVGGGGGGASDLDALSDVVVNTPATAQVLRYNGTNWVNSQLNYNDLGGQPFAQVQADWNQTSTTNVAYIKNKPTNLVTVNSSPTFNDVTVSGNLNVTGTTTTNNVATLNVTNNEVVLNDNLGVFTGDASANSAVVTNIASTTGITQGASVSITGNAGTLTLGTATVQSIDSGTQITLDTNFGGSGSQTAIELTIPVAPTANASVVVERSASNDTRVRWNETNDRWEFTNDGTTYHNIPVPSEYGDYNNLQNLPNLAATQVNSDWNATTGVAQILNKPTVPQNLGDLANVSSAAGTTGGGQTITAGHYLQWNGSQWTPAAVSGGGGGGGSGSLQARTDVAGTSSNLANDTTDSNVNLTGFKSYVLLAVTTSADAWVRLYTTAASRANDLNRGEGTDPSPGSGVIAEVRVDGTQQITPGTIGFNYETTPNTNIYASVTNRSGSQQQITVTLKVVQLEA